VLARPLRLAVLLVAMGAMLICCAATTSALPVIGRSSQGHRKGQRCARHRRRHKRHRCHRRHARVHRKRRHHTPPARQSRLPAGSQYVSFANDPFAHLNTGVAGAGEPSGQSMPAGDLPGWHQVFADDFTTPVPVGGFSGCSQGPTLMTSNCPGLPSAVSAKWWAYPDGWSDTSHNGRYSPSRVLSIHDGALDYYVHTEGGTHMVAAPVPKIPGGVAGGGLQYGAYAVRFRSDLLSGYKAAWLLWPDAEGWPANGEIDFPEGNLDQHFSGFMHWMGGTSGTQQDAYPTGAGFNAWHTAIIEKTPGYCRFILDGTVVGNSTLRIPFDPMHWVLQTETAIDGTVPSDSTSGHVQIDWVAAYTPAS
jgi:hypothetical protein